MCFPQMGCAPDAVCLASDCGACTWPRYLRRQKSGGPQERGGPFPGDGGVRTSVSFFRESVVCERNRNPSETALVCDYAVNKCSGGPTRPYRRPWSFGNFRLVGHFPPGSQTFLVQIVDLVLSRDCDAVLSHKIHFLIGCRETPPPTKSSIHC